MSNLEKESSEIPENDFPLLDEDAGGLTEVAESTEGTESNGPENGPDPGPDHSNIALEDPSQEGAVELSPEVIETGNGAAVPFAGTDWGYVDEEGNVRQKDTPESRGRIVGKMKGDDPQASLAFFVNKFQQATQKVEAIERQMETEGNRARYVGRIQSMLEWIPTADALGDFDALSERLRRLEALAIEETHRNLERKEALCARAEELSESGSWKATGEALKGLQEEWKAVGPVPKERSDEVWKRFRAAQNRFFERRKEHFGRLSQEQQENLRKKEELCVRAEELAESSEWKATAEALKNLQDEWKAAGAAPRDQADAIWKRFRKALNRFFDRRKEHFSKVNQEQKENFRRKEELCVRAEELAESTEWKATAEALKALQEEWRTIGPAPKDKAEAVWARFRAANDRFFNRRAEHFEERDRDRGRRQSEWKERLQETLDRKREQVDRLKESIAHDRENVNRWQANLQTVRPGHREAEIRSGLETKISDVGKKIQAKEDRLKELEESIREIETKL